MTPERAGLQYRAGRTVGSKKYNIYLDDWRRRVDLARSAGVNCHEQDDIIGKLARQLEDE